MFMQWFIKSLQDPCQLLTLQSLREEPAMQGKDVQQVLPHNCLFISRNNLNSTARVLFDLNLLFS